MELIVDDDSGLVAEHTTAFRPFPAIIPVRRECYEALKDILGPQYWSYTPTDPSTFPKENIQWKELLPLRLLARRLFIHIRPRKPDGALTAIS
jgi:hypothetical protein